MKRLIFIVFLSLMGCHFPARVAMEGPGGRNAYNMEVQKTNAEEMLLNLVRLRYYDSPFFLDVSSVTSQFTFKNTASAAIKIPGFNQGNPMSLGGETQWQNQPTIQYSPLEGQEFASQLMQPLDVTTLQQVIYSGWEVDRVFQLAVQDMNEFHNISKEGMEYPIEASNYKNFYNTIFLMRQLQRKGFLKIGIDDKTHLKVLQMAFPKEDEYSKKIAKLLKMEEPANGKYVLRFVQGFDEKGNVGILPRSILSCMTYLSHNVQVPQRDLDAHRAEKFSTEKYVCEEIKNLFQGLMSVYNVPNKPKEFYVCIKYRNTWFYIKDDDLNSKKTFMLLLELYNLQSGRRKDKGPVLTLPIGVG